MVKLNFKIFFKYFVLVGMFVLPSGLLFSSMTEIAPVSISAIVVSSSTPPGPGGGGGGGSGGEISIPTTVNFSGKAYPLSKVYILKNGKIETVTIADPAANFSVSLTGFSTDNYNFSIYGEDNNGRKSSNFSFSIFITAGTTVNIGNIFISPTIDIDKIEVKKGENLAIFGQSIPNSEITISVNSEPEYFFKTLSANNGAYLYNLDTSILHYGGHQTKSKASFDGELSQYTNALAFLVGDKNKFKEDATCGLIRGDLNCDGKVNLVDFSIMAFWYKKPNPPTNVDLNNDKTINLVDFSILAFNWTG